MDTKLIIKAARQPTKVIRALNYKLRSFIGTSDFLRFIVLTRSRTGSNMLISLLDSHPSIRAEGEILRDASGGGYEAALRNVFHRQPRTVNACGFKIFYYHGLDRSSFDVWGYLAGMNDLRVIHLKRRNILRTLVSRKIADSRGAWVADAPGKLELRNKAVSFTAEELLEGFKKTRAWENEGDERFGSHPLLTMHYEDMVADMESNFRRITEFLGVPFVSPVTRLERQNPEALSDLVENFDALRATFASTEWQPFFED